MSPSIRHFELLVITSSSVVWVRWSAIIRATHLAACVVRTAGGSLAEKLCASSAGNHPPAPAWAFSFPSASQTPFTYSCVITRSSSGGSSRMPGKCGPLSSSVNTLKPCARHPRVVTSGLKVKMALSSSTPSSTEPLLSRPPEPRFPENLGFHFGGSLFSSLDAVHLQLCGREQPARR